MTINIQMAIIYHLLTLTLLVLTSPSKQIPLLEPSQEVFRDRSEQVALATNELFSLPITTRTITHRIQTIPENSQQCRFQFQELIYNSLGQSSLLVGEEEITDMLALGKKQKIFLVDQSHNLLTYSLDEHFLLKRLAPKTSIVGSNKKISNIVLTSTEDEQFVYYLTPNRYIVFATETLGVEKMADEVLEGELVDVRKAFVYKGYLILFSRQSLLVIYKIDRNTKKLTMVQSIQPKENTYYADIELDKKSQMFYVLVLNSPQILIFHFEPSEFPSADKSFKILKQYDSINMQSITNKHHSENEEKNIHFDLAISKDREQQTLMVLFLHNYHNVVAEVFYNPVALTWKFVRYFKFSTRVNEIHITKDMLVVVGGQSMGVFPFGIHPRLIDEQLNGLMTLSPIFRMQILENGEFVGITKNTIEYGVIRLSKKAQLVCKVAEHSELKTVKLKANLTACTSDDRLLYESYCSYEKIFMIEQMGLAVTAPVANTIWTGMLIFLTAIIFGLIILFVMRRKKQSEIKKLQMYFSQKRKQQQAPSPSDRRTLSQ